MQDPLDADNGPQRPRVFDAGDISQSSQFDLYNLAAISVLSQEPADCFFSRYAEGRWKSTETPSIPGELALVMPPFRRLESTEMGLPPSPAGPPPDLTKSVEDAYRSFLSSSSARTRTASHSTTLLTPESETNQFNFSPCTDNAKQRSSGVFGDSVGSREGSASLRDVKLPEELGAYSSNAARRYAELGYMEPPMPPNEAQRRRAVRSFKPFNKKLDPNLDRIARIGKTMFASNASLISLIDTDEVQFTFNGKDPYMVPRGTPMCSHTVLLQNDEPLVVLDTLQDWRFKGNKVVTDELDVRFYAGVPLRTEDGSNVGVFCVLDNKPRKEFTEDECAQLKELGAMMMRELQGIVKQQETALRDKMQTSIEAFNHDAVSAQYSSDELLARAVDYIGQALSMEGVLLFDAINSAHGKPSPGERHIWQDRDGVPVPLLAASKHAKSITEAPKPARRGSVTEAMFRDHIDGLVFAEDELEPPVFMRLLPERVVAAAAVPVSRGPSEPFALICAYTLREEYHLRLPKPTLSFLRNMGLILCSVQQKRALSQADKAKVDFIANISHELRTPLHGVMASCDLLSETTLSDTQESFLSTAKQCAYSLTETINHVLDFTKSTSQSVGQQRTAVDLAQLIEETLVGCWWGRTAGKTSGSEALPIGEIYAPQSPLLTLSDKKGAIEPIIDIEPIPNWVVMLDKAGLRRILINIIGNSVKFTQEGYVKVGLYRGVQTDPSSVPIEIVVEDTGMGMSEEFIREKLFHPFSQERPFAQGIGLGLAIVRSILKSPGIDGTVDVQSQVGFGTRMVISLQAPPAVYSPGSTWLRNPVSSSTSTKHLKFALVGFPADNRSTLQLATLLRQHLHRWYTDIAETDPLEATILIFNGDVAHHDLLNDPRRYQQKILVLSSSPVEPGLLGMAQKLSLNGGFCLVTLKPVGPHALARLVSKMIDPSLPRSPVTASRSRLASPSSLSPPKAAPGLPSTRIKTSPVRTLQTGAQDVKPRALVVEDNAVNRKVLAAYLRKRGFEFAEAEDGAEGVKIFNQHPTGYFDICLMDLQMPVLDGFQATANIRQMEMERMSTTTSHEGIHSRLKVYALSGLAAPEDKERASSIGFDGYLVKPVSFKTLDAVFHALPPVAQWRLGV